MSEEREQGRRQGHIEAAWWIELIAQMVEEKDEDAPEVHPAITEMKLAIMRNLASAIEHGGIDMAKEGVKEFHGELEALGITPPYKRVPA